MSFFFFNDTATTEIYTLSLHDALPIYTGSLGLEEAGVELGDGGYITVDKVSRTTARGVYAAGDCTGVLMLASVAAMQGRIAMWHSLGDAVTPLNLKAVSSNVFTAPEIATVGWTQRAVDDGEIEADRKSTRLNSSHANISYAVFCLKK